MSDGSTGPAAVEEVDVGSEVDTALHSPPEDGKRTRELAAQVSIHHVGMTTACRVIVINITYLVYIMQISMHYVNVSPCMIMFGIILVSCSILGETPAAG